MTAISSPTVGASLPVPAVASDTDRLFWVLFPDCQGIIEDVVLLGAPVEGEAKHWEPFRKVVCGRIINGYSRSVRALPRGVTVLTEHLAGRCPRPGPGLGGPQGPVGLWPITGNVF